jgi:hypothetical protein
MRLQSKVEPWLMMVMVVALPKMNVRIAPVADDGNGGGFTEEECPNCS